VKLEKWFKDVGLWALKFRHPQGGAAHVVVTPQEDGQARLDSAWWLDDYDTETRRLAWTKPRTVAADEPELENGLLSEIRQVLSWTPIDLKAESKMMEGTWHNWFTKAEFVKHHRSLPEPRLEQHPQM
jgi:hypothetical protein